jgi:peptidoglycan pentaglycine glycine transferase (the first glycine)
MRLRPATDADAAAWDIHLAATASGDFLHDRAWADVAAFDGQPQRRYLLEDDGRVVAIVAAQERPAILGRTTWYVPHGAVLDYAAPDARDRMRALVAGLREAGRAHGAIAIRLEPRVELGSPEAAALDVRGLRVEAGTLQVRHTRIVDLLDDEEALLASFDKDTRYGVRRAEREGVTVTATDDPDDVGAIDALHGLVVETQRRAGFPLPPLERYRVAWRALAAAGRATILEARHGDDLLASGMVVVEGDRSFYLFSGSRREEQGETKRYPSYALQWAMMRHARERGVRLHDLWGIAPPDAGTEHPWHGVGLFKKGFGGREVTWAGSWEIAIDPNLDRLRRAAGIARGWLRRLSR